ncbi:GNAT family N-acetyltransferase [Hymenobacter sp. BT186]|uniref:GNAT family N-acetyltransferase n=1 Tax=Hymenobacter telluris TaxID=2816474 RepID=A0A939J9S4_9BACT|nr:GNAT family N-acetyltransferase [Hymenobacter telluris]MBO0357341.1 GNAT family N-acetyltransferase [Hymenobacter telluris]MBW3373367.1 GNAT family N-acetyltransferase [Hymenobacter norwichensis]
MLFREANLSDIPALFEVRYAVTENVLRNRALVTTENTADYLTRRGKGWLCEMQGQVVGFAIADSHDHSIWALFVRPECVGYGIGRQLHHLMLAWYFAQTSETVSLSTAPSTRAEEFYRRQGWQETGRTSSGEVRFEMTQEQWKEGFNDV